MLSNLGKFSIALTIAAVIGSITLPLQAALLVSSRGDNSIKQYDETTGAYIQDFVTSGSGGLLSPQGLTLGPDGNLYVSSSNSIKKYDGTTGSYISTFAGGGIDVLFQPNGLVFGPDNNLYVSNTIRIGSTTSGAVIKYDPTTGNFLGGVVKGIQEPYEGLSRYTDVAFDSNGDLYTTFFGSRGIPGQVFKYDPTTGEELSSFQVGSPIGLAISSNDDIYVSDLGGFVYKQSATGSRTAFGSDELNPGTTGLTLGVDGSLFVAETSSNSVKKFDSDTGEYLGDFINSGSGGLSSPSYLTTANVPVPEPSSVLGIVATGGLFVGSTLQRQRNNRKKQPLG